MMVDPYFDVLRDENTRLLNGRKLPDLFDFTRRGEYFPFCASYRQNQRSVCVELF